MGLATTTLLDTHLPRAARTVEPVPDGTARALSLTGATHRQINYWARLGLLGPHLRHRGSGQRRQFTDVDLELIYALVQLASLGCTCDWLRTAAGLVTVRRVPPDGEWLILGIDHHARRVAIDGPLPKPDGPQWVVPLRSFAGAIA